MVKAAVTQTNGRDRLSAWPAWEIAAVGAATVIGMLLRFWRLGTDPLSFDEISSWDFAHQSVPFIFGRLAHIENNPPFYYLLVHLVMRLGESEYLLRLPSAIAGTLAIPLVYVLGRLGGARASGVIGAALLSLSAAGIAYSREARSYALTLDAGLLAAIGAAIVIFHYAGRSTGSLGSARRENAGWALLTLGSIFGFYLHYTFLFTIFALHFSFAMAWFAGTRLLSRTFIVKWLLSCFVLLAGIAWGLGLAAGQSHSENISWIHAPSLRQAVYFVTQVDGYAGISRFQPWLNLIPIGAAVVGLIAGWRRSAAVLVCGVLFALFPTVLFLVSQVRPMFLEKTLLPSAPAACLLAGHGSLFLAGALPELGRRMFDWRTTQTERFQYFPTSPRRLAMLVLLLPAAMSAGKVLGRHEVAQPYDKVAAYLPAVMRPGDVAAGPDGVVYYRRRLKAAFPYFKLVVGNGAGEQVTYGSPTVSIDQVSRLAFLDQSVYIVVHEGPRVLIDGQAYSNAEYVRARLGLRGPPLAAFDWLFIYRIAGTCSSTAPCLRGNS